MAKHLKTGQRGEALAEERLRSLGYRILERNWRFKHLEVDLIAVEADMLVFVEIKTRNDLRYGQPEDSVDWRKERKLARAAEIYIHKTNYHGEIRFDIVSVLWPQDLPTHFDAPPRVEIIKDAFWPK